MLLRHRFDRRDKYQLYKFVPLSTFHVRTILSQGEWDKGRYKETEEGMQSPKYIRD